MFITLGKLLRALHHKVDEVPTSSEARYDQKISQNPEKPSKVDVLIFLVFLFIYNGFLGGKIIPVTRTNKTGSSLTLTVTSIALATGCNSDLEAGGDGGVLIVCSLRISYQIIPAGEHLPAEGEFSLLCSITSFICITSHPEKKASMKVMEDRPEEQHQQVMYRPVSLSVCVTAYVRMTTIRLYPNIPTPTNR